MSQDKILPTRRHPNWNNSHLPSYNYYLDDEIDHGRPAEASARESLTRGPSDIDMQVIRGRMPQRHPRDMSLPATSVTFSPNVADTTPPEAFTRFDIFMGLVSIGTYILDFASDIWLAAKYYQQGDFKWFTLTLTFPIAASLVMMITSLLWYHSDFHDQREIKLPMWRWTLRIVMHMLLLGPLVRYVDALVYGWKSRSRSVTMDQRKIYSTLRLYEDADSAMLRMFECFLESAPQLILQLYIIFTQGHTHEYTKLMFQYVSCFLSWTSLAWCLTSYHAALRLALTDKANMTWASSGFFFLWKLFIIGPRIFALAMFASVFKVWVFIFLTFHVLIMFAWILLQRTSFCIGSCRQVKEVLWNFIVATIYCFEFLNVKEGQTRVKYFIYYGVHYIENLVLVILWHFNAQDGSCCSIEHWLLLGLVLGLFWIGIFFMFIYYVFFHPTDAIKVCINCPTRGREDDDEFEGEMRFRLNSEPPEGEREGVRVMRKRAGEKGERHVGSGDTSQSTRGASSSSSNPVHVGTNSSHSRSVSSPSAEHTEGTVSPEFMSSHNGQYADRYLSYV